MGDIGLKWPGDECPPDCRYSMKSNSTGDGRAHRHCGYILMAGKVRGCDPGAGCVRYDNGRRPRRAMAVKDRRPYAWDIARGRKLWQQGWTQGAIARELGISQASVERRVRLHWKKGED